jgi:RHS repeat-associated protein
MWLPEAGVYYYKARMYSPTLGRFLQTDPIGYADGMNWYAYVGNDPVNATDPSGSVMQQFINCQPAPTYYSGDWESGITVTTTHCQTVFIDVPDRGFSGPRESGGSGGGGLRAPARTEETPQNTKPAQKSRLSCLGSAIWENKTGLLLDTAGWVANFTLPRGSAAVAIAGSTIGVIGIGSAVVDNKGPVDAGVAGTLAYTGKMGATAEGMMRGAGSALGHRIGYAALAASSAYDVEKTVVEYSQCMSGN